MIVGREAVGVEIAQADDVEADRLHRDQILQRSVESADAHSVDDAQMKVVDERLIARNGFENVVVRKCQRRLSRRGSGLT